MYNIIKNFPYRLKKTFAVYYGKKFLDNEVFPLNNIYRKNTPNKQAPENILFINALVGKGGTSKIAYDSLCKQLKYRGFKTNILTSKSYYENSDDVIEFINHSSKERKLHDKIEKKYNLLDFFQKESLDIKNNKEFKECDILHLHNLHGNFFNPYGLPELTALKPTIWTLHDFGALAGYCTVEYNCNKWQNNCFDCEFLNKKSLKDTASYILKEKKSIYKNSNLTLVCPSMWMKNNVEKSILGHFDTRLIYHGIDTEVFNDCGKEKCRQELNLPTNKKILLFSSDFGLDNPQKGGEYLKQVYESLKYRDDLLFIAVGGNKAEQTARDFIQLPYVYNEKDLARYYSAADIFVYPTLADSFGLVVAEALACQTPVISFNTGGVPEILEHGKSGYIAEYKNTEDFISGVNKFLNDSDLINKAGQYGRKTILEKFDLDIMIKNYINLYNEVYEKAKMQL